MTGFSARGALFATLSAGGITVEVDGERPKASRTKAPDANAWLSAHCGSAA